jgi:hypothetical protein
MAWLRLHCKPDEIIYRLPETAIGYCQCGGLPTTATAAVRWPLQFGVSDDRLASYARLLDSRPAELAAYRAAGIVWFVVGPDDPSMERNVRRWVQAGEVVRPAEFGALRIFKLSHAAASIPLD